MLKEQCQNCRFWKPPKAAKLGDCNRYPPTPVSIDDQDVPYTHPEHWCGEFKPKDDVPADA